MSSNVIDSIRDRAAGTVTRETVEEYTIVDGEEQLTRRKVTTKQTPPDMAAAKLLLTLEKPRTLTEAELLAEKRRLLEELQALQENTSGDV